MPLPVARQWGPGPRAAPATHSNSISDGHSPDSLTEHSQAVKVGRTAILYNGDSDTSTLADVQLQCSDSDASAGTRLQA